MQRKKSTDDELCGIEIYCTFLSIAKKETVRPRCLISANDFFRIIRVSPNSGFQSTFNKRLSLQIIEIQSEHSNYNTHSNCVPDLNTYIYMILLQLIRANSEFTVWLKRNIEHKKTAHEANKSQKQKQSTTTERKKLIDFSAWIKTKLSTQCIKWIKNLFCSDKR